MNDEEPAFFVGAQTQEPSFSEKLGSCSVAIIGLGLMGASLALDLRGQCREIVGVSRSQTTLDYAITHRIVDRIVDFEAALTADLVILAAPVRTILQQLHQIREAQSAIGNLQSTTLLDLGSTKTEIAAAMQNLPARFDPIGGHPMCGKEVAGIQHAESRLYRDKTFILTPLERTTPAGLALALELIAALGARPLVLPAEVQDSLVASISHLPYLAAVSLVRAAQAKQDEMVWRVAASGFRDTTRVAGGDVTMFLDILLTNRAAILETLQQYRSELDTLVALLESADEPGLRAFLEPAQAQRSKMFK
jgi:prephenate dehydrogenase